MYPGRSYRRVQPESSLTYVYTRKYVISTGQAVSDRPSTNAHSCMYQGVGEQVRNICLSSIHTRLLITYCTVSTPRWIARSVVLYAMYYGPRCYFIIDIVHRREDVNRERNDVTLDDIFCHFSVVKIHFIRVRGCLRKLH